MRSLWLFLTLFWILVLLLIASVVRNLMHGQALLGLGEFILIGFLAFLVIGDEFVKVRLTKSCLEIEQKKGSGAVAHRNKHDKA